MMKQETSIKQEMSSSYGGMDLGSGGGNDYSAGFNLNPQQQRVLKAVAVSIVCHFSITVLSNRFFMITYLKCESGCHKS